MKIVCLLPFAFCFFNSFSQTCCIEWQKCLGGSNDDFGSVVRQTADGGYIACGYTWSSDGDVSGLHQSLGVYCDAWLVKTDSAGNILWQKCRGGSYGDGFFDVRTTTDSGYIAAGFTWSNDFDVSGNHGVAGAQSDFWITKLDSAGELIWQKCFGGSGDDEAKMVQQTPDGGYIVAGTTFSNDGDALGSHGDFDALVFRLDSAGNILWHKCLGGTEEEKIQTVEQEADGGFIFSIFTKSNDGDVSGNHGFGDAWFVKTDSSGNMVWQRCIGGNYDDNAAAFSRTADGGFILTGHSGSDDSIFTSCNGVNNFDFWQVKTDSAFNVIRKKCFGGTKPDFAYDMQIASDGGFISCGITKSNDGDVTGNHDTTGLFTDAWIVKTDSSGLLQWQFASGGSMTDDSRSVLQTPDGGWLVAGSANSTDGDVTGNHGSYDLRLVKLSAVTGIEENNSVPVSVNIFPNPSGGIVQIGFPVSPGSKWKCEVLNLLGEKVFLKSISSSAQEEVLNLSFLCRGIYVLRLSNGKISVSKLLAIE